MKLYTPYAGTCYAANLTFFQENVYIGDACQKLQEQEYLFTCTHWIVTLLTRTHAVCQQRPDVYVYLQQNNYCHASLSRLFLQVFQLASNHKKVSSHNQWNFTNLESKRLINNYTHGGPSVLAEISWKCLWFIQSIGCILGVQMLKKCRMYCEVQFKHILPKCYRGLKLEIRIDQIQ